MSDAYQQTSEDDDGFKHVGQSYDRVEGLQFVNGTAEYAHDITEQRMLHGAILRSPHAHARIVDIDTSAAEELDGVHGVLIGEEVADRTRALQKEKGAVSQDKYALQEQYALSPSRVRYVGDAVAAVVAEDKYTAKDAIDRIHVDYEPLPSVTDTVEALEDDAPLVHPELEGAEGVDGNCFHEHFVSAGDVEAGFEEADHIVEDEFRSGCFSGAPMETPGCVASWDQSSETLEIQDSTQIPYRLKGVLSGILKLRQNQVRVIKPEVGGGFGNKASIYAHEIVACLFAMDTGRPVKFVLDRDEHLGATRSSYAWYVDGRLGVKSDGTITAMEMDILHDEGAYHLKGIPIMGLAMSGPSDVPYKIPNLQLNGKVVFTHKVPGGPIRGTGLRQLALARERLLDQAASDAGLDPLDLRERNFISNEECPYETPKGTHLDSSGIEAATEAVREEYEAIRAEIGDDPYKGVGVSSVMKWSSCRHLDVDTDYDSVVVELDGDGTVVVRSPSADMGTATRTTLAQVVAEELGVEMQDVSVIEGDTKATPPGLGSFGSRTMTLTGTTAVKAANEIRNRILKIASHNLEIHPRDLRLDDGYVMVKGDPETRISMQEIAGISYGENSKLPDDMTTGALLAKASFDSSDPSVVTPTNHPDENGQANMSMTYSATTFVTQVEVDPETGNVDIQRVITGDDVGKAVNPDVVRGQLQGGAAQGLSAALGEELIYNENGQILNNNYGSYPVLTSADLCSLDDRIVEVPSRNTPGGWKGAGETPTTAAPCSLANAVSDAIGDSVTEVPVLPHRVVDLIED